jgi:ubiquinol-cytochrome c reductase cytochrome c1 subunit
MSKDVSAFLAWTAEPKMQIRKATGLGAVIFLLAFCFLAYGAYKNVWRNKAH